MKKKSSKKFIICSVGLLGSLMMITSCGKPPTVQIFYDTNYDEGEVIRVTLRRGGTIDEYYSPSPTREGDFYKFTDWYEEKECTTQYDHAKPVEKQITLYAGWEKNFYTLTFDDNHDKGTTQTKRILKTQPPDKIQPATTKEGCQFTAWYKEKECTNLFDFSVVLEGDTTVYAGWESTLI